MANKRDVLVEGKFYHIYNHSIGNENLFKNDDNFLYFMKLWSKYIQSIANTYAYCLMPNHFHFIVRIKEISDISIQKGFENSSDLYSNINISSSDKQSNLSQIFGNCFNAYSKAYNKMYSRSGSLFMESFHRKCIDSEVYLRKLIIYIHQNPIADNFVLRLQDWKYSLCNAILSKSETLIPKNEIINLFDDIDNFIYCHKFEIDLNESDL